MGGRIDSAVFHSINGWPEFLSPTMRFFSEATTYLWVKLLLLGLVVALLWLNPKTRRTAVQALLAFPIANELTDVWKTAYPVNRPFQVDQVILRMGATDSMGTASAHSANMAAVAFVFTYHLGWWGVPWIFLALLTGLSRVYNGVHYPSQAILGWLCGLFAGFVVTKTWEALVRARKGVKVNVADEP